MGRTAFPERAVGRRWGRRGCCVAAVLLAAGLARAQEEEAPAAPSDAGGEVLALVREIEGNLERVREREFLLPTDAGVHTREQLREYLCAQLDQELPPEKRRGWELAAKAFGMIPEECDLEQTLLDFLVAQVGGFYDPATKKLYCMSSPLKLLNYTVLVHELAHAQQDQYDDLERYYDAVRDHDDRALARQCVVEGEAQFLTERYLAEFPDALAALASEGDSGELLKFGLQQGLAQIGAPPYLSALLTFPYLGGMRFVRQVKDRGGWEAVADLYAHPPLSSEQILHPEKFLDPAQRDDPTDVPAADLCAALGADWQAVYANALGEFQTEVFVRLAGDPVRALRGSYGWDGDRYCVYQCSATGAVFLQWVAVFDSENDAAEMIDALRRVLERRSSLPDAGRLDVKMDAEKERVTARDAVGAPRALAARRGEKLVYLFGLEAGMDAAGLEGAALQALGAQGE